MAEEIYQELIDAKTSQDVWAHLSPDCLLALRKQARQLFTGIGPGNEELRVFIRSVNEAFDEVRRSAFSALGHKDSPFPSRQMGMRADRFVNQIAKIPQSVWVNAVTDLTKTVVDRAVQNRIQQPEARGATLKTGLLSLHPANVENLGGKLTL